MLVDDGAVWENDRGDEKSHVRDDEAVVDFRSTQLMKLYNRNQIHN
jgi:hypothetical protein